MIVRRLLYRAVLFIPAASAVWALLPVVAADNLDLGSGGYGLLLGMVGTGAVAGAIVIPRLRAKSRIGPSGHRCDGGDRGRDRGDRHRQPGCRGRYRTVAGRRCVDRGDVVAELRDAAGLAQLGARPRAWPTTWWSSRARRPWGQSFGESVADLSSATTALLIAAAVLVGGVLVGLRSPMPDTSKLDRTPSTHWPAPQLTFTPDATDGPVMVTVTYRVAEESARDFTHAMQGVGRSRRRTGALRWELFRDGSDPTRFVESYLIGTWEEHVRQHQTRLTGADRRFEDEAKRHALGEPEVAHLFPPPTSGPLQ